MKAYIGEEAGGAAVLVGVQDGEVKVARSVALEDGQVRDHKVVQRALWLRFEKGVPHGWRRAPEYDEYVEDLYSERL